MQGAIYIHNDMPIGEHIETDLAPYDDSRIRAMRWARRLHSSLLTPHFSLLTSHFFVKKHLHLTQFFAIIVSLAMKQATSLPMRNMGHKSEKEANFVKKYEVMFIVNVANDEVIKAAVKLVQDTIARIGGTVDKVDEWGKRHLAYEVKHQSEGYYVVVDFQADPAQITELDRVIKIHEEIIRHIIVKQDD